MPEIKTQSVVQLPGIITLRENDRKSLSFDFLIEGFVYALNNYIVSGSDYLYQELGAHPEVDTTMTLRVDNLETDIIKASGSMLSYLTANHSHYIAMLDESNNQLDEYLLSPIAQPNRLYKLASPIILKKGDVLTTSLAAEDTATLVWRGHLLLVGKRVKNMNRKISYIRDTLADEGIDTPLDTKGNCEINRLIFEIVKTASPQTASYADIDVDPATPTTYEHTIQGLSLDVIYTKERDFTLIKDASAGILYRYSGLMYDVKNLITGYQSLISVNWTSKSGEDIPTGMELWVGYEYSQKGH